MRHVDNNNNKIIDIQYFGNIELYSTLINERDISFYSETIYEKARHANRMVINGPNGLIPLSIPLLGGRNQRGIFKDIQIAQDGKWRRIHWRSIHDSYRKSPWFEELGWQVEALYQKPEKYLMDWNYKTMQWTLNTLQIKLDISAQTQEQTQVSINEKKPTSASVNEQSNYPVYTQVFQERFGFNPNLCILDLLFCEGPASSTYLSKLNLYKKQQKNLVL